ncbi:MAG: glycosyl transferase, partial [Polaromonas sp.]|nr:glycosyl transferase [Gemmatimonadaceae bacterium]
MPDRGWRDALVVTAVATMLRLLLAAWLPLFPDETYYWEWSRHLAAGYYDHPPAIAVLVAMGARLGTLLGAGPSPFFVRLVPVLVGGVATLAGGGIARRNRGGRAA